MAARISEFEIQYAYWLEDMQYTFWRRIDAFINIALIVLGAAVTATLDIDVVIGLTVAMLAAINVVIQPLRKAINARTQATRYSKILDSLEKFADDELQKEIDFCSENNSDEIGTVTSLAYNQAAISMNKRPTKRYHLGHKLIGLFIGHLPESQK